MVILGLRLASGAVDAVKSVGLELSRLWRILVPQSLVPTHDVISHSDPGAAVDQACQAVGVDSLLDGTYAKGDYRVP